MNGYDVLSVFESIAPPSAEVRTSKEWFRYYLAELAKRRPDLTISTRTDSLQRYTHLKQDEPTTVECELFPAPSDVELEMHKQKVLAKGIYGQTYLVRMRKDCMHDLDPRIRIEENHSDDHTLSAVVKDMLPVGDPSRVYENMLHEVLINQLVLRDTIIREGSLQFPLQYAYIICAPNLTDDATLKHQDLSTRFCDAPLQNYTSDRVVNRDLLRGKLRMFCVQEKVNGSTWGDAIDSGVYSHEDPLEMLSILFQIFGALDQLNARRVYTHNDLHLNNVMLVPSASLSIRFEGSDGITREISQAKHIAVLIDEGRASGSYEWKGKTYLAVLDTKYGAFMGTDILRMFYNMLGESPRGGSNYAIVKRMLGRLFGPDVFVFMKQRETPESFSDFMMFLHQEFGEDMELWKTLISVSYLQALLVVEEELQKIYQK